MRRLVSPRQSANRTNDSKREVQARASGSFPGTPRLGGRACPCGHRTGASTVAAIRNLYGRSASSASPSIRQRSRRPVRRKASPGSEEYLYSRAEGLGLLNVRDVCSMELDCYRAGDGLRDSPSLSTQCSATGLRTFASKSSLSSSKAYQAPTNDEPSSPLRLLAVHCKDRSVRGEATIPGPTSSQKHSRVSMVFSTRSRYPLRFSSA